MTLNGFERSLMFNPHKIGHLVDSSSAQLGRDYAYFVLLPHKLPAKICLRIGNPRGAILPAKDYSTSMSARLGKLLHNRSPQLKREWLRRLKEEPPRTALARVEILSYRMDGTLLELEGLVNESDESKSTRRGATLESKLRKVCRCGLNPMLDYFLTADDSFPVVLPKLNEMEWRDLERSWHAIALREVGGFCSFCCRKSDDGKAEMLLRAQCLVDVTTRAR